MSPHPPSKETQQVRFSFTSKRRRIHSQTSTRETRTRIRPLSAPRHACKTRQPSGGGGGGRAARSAGARKNGSIFFPCRIPRRSSCPFPSQLLGAEAWRNCAARMRRPAPPLGEEKRRWAKGREICFASAPRAAIFRATRKGVREAGDPALYCA